MRRADIISSCQNLQEAIAKSALIPALQALFNRQDKSQPVGILSALNAFSLIASKFTPTTLELMRVFDIDGILDANTWPSFLEPERRGEAMQCYSALNGTQVYLPKFIKLLHQKGQEEYRATLPPQMTDLDVSIISVILLETTKEFSTPERLIEILEATTELYTGVALVLGKSANTLTVLSCDSGSDKSFDFLGHGDVIKYLKELIIELWDNVVFYKERKAVAQLGVISEGLSVYAKIAELESSNAIAPELAEQIRRMIAGGATKFVKAGAIIPEISEHTHHEPRALMAPERKLLMPPPAGNPPSTTPPPPPLPVSTATPPVDMAAILERLQKLEQHGPGVTPATPPEPPPSESQP